MGSLVAGWLNSRPLTVKCALTGFAPSYSDTPKKAHNGRGCVSCQQGKSQSPKLMPYQKGTCEISPAIMMAAYHFTDAFICISCLVGKGLGHPNLITADTSVHLHENSIFYSELPNSNTTLQV